MKKFTLIASAALLAATVSAAGSETPRADKFQAGGHAGSSLMTRAGHRSADGIKLVETLRNSDTRVKMRRAGIKPITDDIITETPAGTVTHWSRDCMGWFSFFGYVLQEPAVGITQQIVDAGPAESYLNLLVSQFPLQAWIKADKDDDGNLTISSGQLVYQEEYEGDMYNFYIVALDNITLDEEGYMHHDCLESVKFNYVDGKYEQDNPDIIVGLCEFDPEDDAYYWTGYGDDHIVFTPVTDEVVTLPADVAAEPWAVITTEGGYFANVGFDGDKIYIQGLLSTAPEACAVGKIDGNTVTFAGGQFMGATDMWTWAYLYGGTIEEIWDDYWEEYVTEATVSGDMHFTYDAAAKTLTTDEVLVITAHNAGDIADLNAESYLEITAITRQTRNPEAVPMNPVDVSFYDEYELYGQSEFYFSIPEFDVEGTLLDAANLYYRVYVDGELFMFYDDEYPATSADGLEMLNVNFTNYENIFISGIAKCVNVFFQGADDIGVQSVYMQPVEGGEPVELCSEIITVSTDSVLELDGGDGEVVSSVYYDMQGRKVDNPATGLYIRRDTMNDGTVHTVKVALR